MCPGLNTRCMGGVHQGDITFRKLMGKRVPKQLQFTAAGAIEQDFYELADRPAMTWQRLIKFCKTGGRCGTCRPGKLGGPP